MRFRVTVHNAALAGGGELGGFWDSITGILGTVAGPVAGLIPGVSQNVANIIGAGTQAALQMFLPKPSAGGQAKGLAAIQQFTQTVLSKFDEVTAQLQSGQFTPDQAKQAAAALVGSLSNEAYVYQAQRGDDAAVLSAAKVQAAQRAGQINTLAAQIAAQQPAGNTGNSPTGNDPGSSLETPVLGMPLSTWILLGGGGLAAYFFLTSK